MLALRVSDESPRRSLPRTEPRRRGCVLPVVTGSSVPAMANGALWGFKCGVHVAAQTHGRRARGIPLAAQIQGLQGAALPLFARHFACFRFGTEVTAHV